MSFSVFIDSTVSGRKNANRYRSRTTVKSLRGQHVSLVNGDTPLINFCGNDYLGLSQHPKVIEAFNDAAKTFGVGSGASHLVSGHSRLHHECELRLAAFLGREAALLFSCGYMTNMGVLSGLMGKSDAIFQDKLNHASLIDGALLSRASMRRYRHNDVNHLDRLLTESCAQKKLVAVDGVFSMDGDTAPVGELSSVCKKHDAWLMVDEAHGLGCIGEGGRGICHAHHLSQNDVPIVMGTLGKAIGTFGAFVAGSRDTMDALVQLSRTYIYTTALPPAVAAATIASMDVLEQEPQHMQRLHQLIYYFKERCCEEDITVMPSSSAIQPVLIGDEKTAIAVSDYLKTAGLWVVAIRPPTVPVGTSRLRITLSAAHTKVDVDTLVTNLKSALTACGCQ